MGVSPRVLRGWTPKSFTEYAYENRPVVWWKPWTWYPRILSTTTTVETQWDDDDYELMLAYAGYENELHDCGHPLSETTSILADASNPNREFEYKAQLPIRCHACTAIAQAQKAYQGENFDASRIWVVDRLER